MNKHRVSIPRGAGVIPFARWLKSPRPVWVSPRLGQENSGGLGSVYLYEQASTGPHLTTLPQIQAGQYEGLKRSYQDPRALAGFWPPWTHPTPVTAVGAREFLIALTLILILLT